MGRLKFEDIIKEVEEADWTLLSTSYKNLKEDLSFKCPNGHVNYYSLEKWRKGHHCITCEKNPFKGTNNKVIKKTGYRILAVDQASITSGWAIFDDKTLISYGSWTSEGKHSTERIGQTKYWLSSMIEKWKPDLVVFEDIQLQKYKDRNNEDEDRVIMFKKLAHLQGTLKNYAFEIGLPYDIISPSTWREYSGVTGKYRTDKKKSAQLIVEKIYEIKVDNDAADAILLGRYAAEDKYNHSFVSFM